MNHEVLKCGKCHSKNLIKMGTVWTPKGGKVQRFQCRDCGAISNKKATDTQAQLLKGGG